MDILVVGGGCLGACAALESARRGHRVELRERAALGSGSTGRAAGVLSSVAWDGDEHRLIARTREVLAKWCAEEGDGSPHRGAWRPLPSLVVASGPEGAARLDQVAGLLERRGEPVRRIGARDAARCYPGVAFAAGEEVLVLDRDGVVDAGHLMGLLESRMRAAGVRLRVGADAGPLPVAEGRVEGWDAVVVAAGAWTAGMVARVGGRIAAAAFRTQLACLETPASALPVIHDAVHHMYLRPESGSTVLAGDGTDLRPHDPEAFDAAADSGFREHIARAVTARLGAGGAARWRTGWAGLCVGTPDRRPLCGPVPGVEGLHVLTGDNGFGLMRCAALGERVADAVEGRVDPRLDPGRFGRRPDPSFPLREGFSL